MLSSVRTTNQSPTKNKKISQKESQTVHFGLLNMDIYGIFSRDWNLFEHINLVLVFKLLFSRWLTHKPSIVFNINISSTSVERCWFLLVYLVMLACFSHKLVHMCFKALQAHLNDEKLTILFVLKYWKTEKPQSQSWHGETKENEILAI